MPLLCFPIGRQFQYLQPQLLFANIGNQQFTKMSSLMWFKCWTNARGCLTLEVVIWENQADTCLTLRFRQGNCISIISSQSVISFVILKLAYTSNTVSSHLVLISSLWWKFHAFVPGKVIWKVTEFGLSTRIPATPMGDLDGVTGSWLYLDQPWRLRPFRKDRRVFSLITSLVLSLWPSNK